MWAEPGHWLVILPQPLIPHSWAQSKAVCDFASEMTSAQLLPVVPRLHYCVLQRFRSSWGLEAEEYNFTMGFCSQPQGPGMILVMAQTLVQLAVVGLPVLPNFTLS